MRLRTAIFLLASLAVSAVFIGINFQVRRTLDESVMFLETAHINQITEIVKSSIVTKRVGLQTIGAVLSRDNDLASAYILSKESHDESLIRKRLNTLKSDTGISILYIERPNSSKNSQAEDIDVVDQKPAILLRFPLHLYENKVGVVVVGEYLERILEKSNTTLESVDLRLIPSRNTISNSDAIVRKVYEKNGWNIFAEITVINSQAVSLGMFLSRNLAVAGILALLLLYAAIYCFLEFGFIRRYKKLVSSIDQYSSKVSKGKIERYSPDEYLIKENDLLAQTFSNLSSNLLDYGEKVQEIAALNSEINEKRALHQLARQVAHDIRSPMSAINLVVGSMNEIPEDKRLLIRSAAQRINDIANELLRKTKHAAETKTTLTNTMIVGVVESVISEKRTEYTGRGSVHFRTDLEGAYGLFVKLDITQFARALSNLINNSVEAIHESGFIDISIRSQPGQVVVTIKDSGCGISKETLEKIGSNSFISSKPEGNGLGIPQVKSMLESIGGRLQIQSELNHGTSVSVVLPRQEAPPWFVSQLIVRDEQTVVTIDDDLSIHEVWARRLTTAGATARHITFASPEQFRKWHAKQSDLSKCLFLIDFEFLGNQTNGCMLIEELALGKSAILVTSRHDDQEVLRFVEKAGIRMVPKGLTPYIPILKSGDSHSISNLQAHT